MGRKIEMCHICNNKKRPYTLFVDGELFTLEQHEKATVEGPICNKCNLFFAITDELREPSDKEFKLAIDAMRFILAFSKWWGKDKSKYREWPGKKVLVELFMKKGGKIVL